MAKRSHDPGTSLLSIGALSNATGIPVETLRNWEARYGFPVPQRKPSGHRVYSLESVERLKLIAAALTLGLRPSDVIGSSSEALAKILAAVEPEGRDRPPAGKLVGIDELLGLVKLFDGDRLTRILTDDWARLTPYAFLEQRIAPLLRAVGEAWSEQSISIRHEHFLSEQVGDLLRALRTRLEERAAGPRIVLASLPGENHGLGLQMAALAFAAAGCRVTYLGTEVPLQEIEAIARDADIRAVALSVSSATGGPPTAQAIRRLRERLPKRVALLVGGDGAPKARPGIEPLHGFQSVESWCAALRER